MKTIERASKAFSTKETAIHSNYGYLVLDVYGISQDIETGTVLVGWEIKIRTASFAYFTSAKNHTWTIEGITRTGSNELGRVKQTGTAPINTDINDLVVVASGVMECPKYNYTGTPRYSFTASVNFTDAICVNVNSETGTTLNKTVSVSDGSGTQGVTIAHVPAYYGGIVSANNFTDEETISITYKGLKAGSLYNNDKYSITMEMGLSFDGEEFEAIRTVPTILNDTDINNYTLALTTEEKTVLYKKMANMKAKTVYLIFVNTNYSNYLSKITAYDGSHVKRTLTIINGEPVLSPVVKDTNATTLALTGDENKIVRYSSNAYVASNVVLQKYAGSLTSHFISVGGRYAAAQTHTFNAVEGNTFTFTATDSRGFNTTIDVKPPFVDYVKLTCNIDAEPVAADDGTLHFTISGNCFSGSFGAVSNNLGLVYRLRRKSDAWGSWVNVSNYSHSGNTYNVDIEVGGLNYQETYELQAMATDRLNTISTPIQTLTTIPIFDWGNSDFNFNVPVNFSDTTDFDKGATFNSTANVKGAATFGSNATFNGDTATFNGNTATFNGNTATFNSDVVFNGNVDFGDNTMEVANINTTKTTFDTDNLLADYIIETGTEAMGTNGTWKWQKWKSGKAEAWGKRNFGNMGVSTAYYGSLYQSANFTQDLPSIFNAEPDVIDINIIKTNAGTAAGAFVLRGLATDASATSTGSFAIAKRNSGTLSQVYLGFHVVGAWK